MSSAAGRTLVHTGSHWGMYAAEVEAGRVVGVRAFAKDPRPSPIIGAMPSAAHAECRIARPVISSMRRPLARLLGLDISERSYYFDSVPALGRAAHRVERARPASKGEQTREAILVHALGLATRVGLEGLTIGRLADDLGMSKSGLFAHFRSKEALQIEILRLAGARMVEAVVKPALAAPRGEPRVRALFENWLAWEQSPSLPGGCPFMAASFELDDRPGPVRDFVVQSLRDWSDTLAGAARIAVQEGHFRADLDCEQFAHDCGGIALAFVHASRLIRDPKARDRAAIAFEALLRAARAPASTSATPISGHRR